jgi:hypothetical protein
MTCLSQHTQSRTCRVAANFNNSSFVAFRIISLTELHYRAAIFKGIAPRRVANRHQTVIPPTPQAPSHASHPVPALDNTTRLVSKQVPQQRIYLVPQSSSRCLTGSFASLFSEQHSSASPVRAVIQLLQLVSSRILQLTANRPFADFAKPDRPSST